jgi:hypothetical protein
LISCLECGLSCLWRVGFIIMLRGRFFCEIRISCLRRACILVWRVRLIFFVESWVLFVGKGCKSTILNILIENWILATKRRYCQNIPVLVSLNHNNESVVLLHLLCGLAIQPYYLTIYNKQKKLQSCVEQSAKSYQNTLV